MVEAQGRALNARESMFLQKVEFVLALVVLSFFLSLAAFALEVEPEGEVPLSEELEGLSPEARIAYLRYLLSSRGQDAEVHFQLAVAFHESDEADSALYHYQTALSIDPGMFKAYVNMGVLLDDRRRPDLALAMLRRALEIEPDDKLANAHTAYVLLMQKDFETAWRHLSRALRADSNDAQSRFYLAIFFYECGIYREALVEWEKVLELSPGSPLAREAERNISMLQRALTEAASSGEPIPERIPR